MVCYPEGADTPCEDNMLEGWRACDHEGLPSKIRVCRDGKFYVESFCPGVCDSRYGDATCYYHDSCASKAQTLA